MGLDIVKRYWALFFLTLASFAPAILRWLDQGLQPAGLYSDYLLGLTLFLLAWASPRWLRFLLVLLWAIFQSGAQELFSALQRFPVWQDLHYLTNVDFVKNSTAGFKLAEPLYTVLLLGSASVLALLPLPRLSWRVLASSAGLLVLLYFGHSRLPFYLAGENLQARYNPLHWFVLNAMVDGPFSTTKTYDKANLPQGFKQADLQGATLLERPGRARNVLIIILEGIPGLYIPEMRQVMGLRGDAETMPQLAASTQQAMLIPDFVVHSHQTIRGLYSLICGDFSKLSWGTPKAFELQAFPDRAQDCLPAQLKKHGWSTHYLQAAGLGFMSKDRFMPLAGFEHVHGQEWFTETNPFPFEWGVVDSVFFRGARRYIQKLEQRDSPWMLTLLTVATHQPYGVTDAIAARYPSRKAAAVALLDDAVATFLKNLHQDGVLKDTLVIITSDESHGSEKASWISSWGLAMILAPDGAGLPRIKQGGYGLVDINVSVLDYFHLPVPAFLIGRSFFRDYTSPREMISYTAGSLRRHTSENMRYECSDDGRCLVGPAASLLGDPPAPLQPKQDGLDTPKSTVIARILDDNLHSAAQERVLSFAEGEQRRLTDSPGNDWSNNLVGAQYLDFPSNSVTEVRMRLQVLQAPTEGLQLRLLVKEWEYDQKNITIPELPVLQSGDVLERSFSFNNNEARKNFSFFLIGDDVDALVQIDQFDVVIRTDKG
ncbi:MAG: LTA synthase family protein [Desulfobulbus sp.]|jgi:hypothetical protein